MKAELFEGLLARCTVGKRHEMRYVSEVFISQPLFFWAVCSCAMTPIPGWSSLLSDCGRMHERKWSSVRLFRLTASSVTKRGRLWADFRLPHFLIAWPTYEVTLSSHLATASSEPASGKAWQNRFLFLPQLPFSKQKSRPPIAALCLQKNRSSCHKLITGLTALCLRVISTSSCLCESGALQWELPCLFGYHCGFTATSHG